ncbi:MAG: hypothetical protein ABUT20_63355 [Bacteroidota bacterium]
MVRDENKRKVKRLLLSEWNKKKEYYEELYGHLPEDSKRLVNVTSLKVDIDNNSQAKVTMDDGRIEMYNLNDEKEKKVFRDKYRLETTETPDKMSEINSPNGQNIMTTSPVTIEKTNVGKNIGTTTSSPVIEIQSGAIKSTNSKLAEPVQSIESTNQDGNIILQINKNTSENELRQFLPAELKAKGYDFKVIKSEYHNGKLIYLNATIVKDGVKKTFTISDFSGFGVSEASPEKNKKVIEFSINKGSLVWE